MPYIRQCPQCGKNIEYKNKRSFGRALSSSTLCQTCVKKGRILSDETRRKLSTLNSGKNSACYGRKHTDEARRKMSLSKGGDGDIERLKASRTKEYNQAVKIAILEAKKRDEHTCQRCGSTKGKMHGHHVKQRSKHPDLATDLDNIITLCVDCHIKEHPWMKNSSNTWL